MRINNGESSNYNSGFSIPAGRILRWFLVGLAIIAVLGLVFIWIVRALPHIALAQIGELTNTRISAESVNLGLNGSVLIKNLVIRPDRGQQYDDAILKAETVYARFGLGSLLLLGPQLREIRVNDFVFDAQYDLDTGRWNVAAMKIRVPRNGSSGMPAVHLSQGTLQYSKVSNGQATVTASVPVRAEFGFDQWTQEGCRFNIRTAALSSGFGKSNLSGFFRPGRFTVTGGVSSTDIPSLEWAWAIDVLAAELTYGQDRDYSLKLRAKGCHSTHTATADPFGLIGPSPLAKSTAFSALQSFFSRYRPSGTVDIDLDASGNLDRLNEITANGKVYCKDVSVCDRHFPYAIEHLAGQIDFTQDSVVLNALSGKHGDVDITIYGLVNGFGPAQQYQLRVSSNNMRLDNDLYNVLSVGQKNLWDAFSPGGLVAIDQRFSRKLQADLGELSRADTKATLRVELLDAQAAYKYFPYPLRHLTGKLFFEGDSVLVSDVVSQIEGCKISFNGNVGSYDTEQPTCYLSIKADNVPLDSTLAAALPDKSRSFYNRFDLAGLADAQIKVFTLQQGDGSASGESIIQQAQGRLGTGGFLADVTLKEASLSVFGSSGAAKEKAGESPLEIRDISAKAVITPDSISIKEFSGQCSDGRVSIAGGISLMDQDSGQLSPVAQPSRYHLTVNAQQTQLTSELIGLLPAPVNNIFSALTPQGRINLAADLTKAAADEVPSYQIVVQCLGDSAAFAYPLKNIVGRLMITNNTVTFEDVTAAPAAPAMVQQSAETSGQSPPAVLKSRIGLNGQITLADGAVSGAALAVSASDIAFDEQLGTALTKTGIAPFYGRLAPAGRFDLDLQDMKIFASQTNEKYAEFTGNIRLKDCKFDLSGVQAGLDAQLRAKGSYKIGTGFSSGTVDISADTLRIKGKAINNLKAEVNYNPDAQNWVAENLFADCYGGQVMGKLEFKRLSQQSIRYLLQAGFDRVDLKQFLADTGLAPGPVPGANDRSSGTMMGALSIAAELGTARDPALRDPKAGAHPGQIGQCRFIIRDMEVGKLSPLAKLLYVLKLTEPKDFAFEQMVVDSYIKGDKLLFEKFDLSGQAIAFSGSGWMDLGSDNVDLVLTARGKRLAAAEPSLVQSLAEGLGQAVVRMEVTGNVHDPQVTTRALPVIEDSLKILGTRR